MRKNLSTLNGSAIPSAVLEIFPRILLSSQFFNLLQKVVRLHSPRQQISEKKGSERVAQNENSPFILRVPCSKQFVHPQDFPLITAPIIFRNVLTDVKVRPLWRHWGHCERPESIQITSRSNISKLPLNHWNGPLNVAELASNLALKLSKVLVNPCQF